LFSCYVKAIFATRPGKSPTPLAITDADVAQRLAKSGRLAQIFSGYPVIHDRVYALFANRLTDARRPSHCGAPGGRILIFDPAGRIFPCNNVVGDMNHQIGTYYPLLRWNDDVRQAWMRRTVGQMPSLSNCRYAFFCGGGCLYDAQVQHGSIHSKSCDCDKFPQEFENLILASYQRIFRAPALSRSSIACNRRERETPDVLRLGV
jgi:radical SAM protein with 4Fe4S-binding SPASM domain